LVSALSPPQGLFFYGWKMKKEDKLIKHKVITMLDRKEMEFLDKLGIDALFTTGHKLTYNDILKGLVDLAMTSGVTGENITTARDLTSKLYEKLRKEIKGLDQNKEENSTAP